MPLTGTPFHDAIAAADARIRTDPRLSATEHLVVAHRGTIVAAHAYRARGLDQAGDIFSITKSVVSTLVGIARRDGLIELDRTLGDLLGPRVPAGRRAVTVRHLLTMTGGADPAGPYDIDEIMTLPRGWLDALLAAPTLAPPGERFAYDNGAVHVLAAGLHPAIGRDLQEYAEQRLFGPLGISGWSWPRDPDGLTYGFGHLRLSPLDLVRFGRLWMERRPALLDAAYAAEATTAHTSGGPPENLPYGYLWWTTTMAGRSAFIAGGYAGQHLVVVPSLELITVTTGAEPALPPGWRPALDVIPSIVAAAGG
ncbi:beta-lactamase family protein [Streptosporangiaceae bacterium NEAU-GS5]|nr:beta-lactamase family protein [Streptosporangiaceae bacterium NEAU-GS5]